MLLLNAVELGARVLVLQIPASWSDASGGIMARRAWGEGTIHQRKDGLFEGKVSLGIVDGQRIRKTIYGQSKREVAEALRDLKLRFQGADFTITVGEYLTDWLEAGREHHKWALNTYRLRETVVRNHLIPYIGGRRLRDIDVRDIKALLQRWIEAGTSSSIKSKAFKTLSGVLNAAFREEIIFRNPCAFVTPLKHRRAPVPMLTVDQSKRLMSETEPLWLRTIITVAIMTAFREGELFALRWDNVDFECGTIRVEGTVVEDEAHVPVVGPPKTKASFREIVLPARAAAALQAHRDADRAAGYDGPWIFHDADGALLRKSNFIRRQFKPALKQLGLPDVRFHSLRHVSNSVAIQQGANPLDIANRNGQTDTRMVLDIYGHLFKAADRTVATAMDAVFDQLIQAELPENGRKLVVNTSVPNKRKTRKPLQATGDLVEMRRLELLTPYMRSKCSTS
jgi:integrase